MTNFVYVADCGDGIRKIGWTVNAEARMKMLARSNRRVFTLERTWERPHDDARTIEALAHCYLRDRRIDRLGQEFFAATQFEAWAAVERAIVANVTYDERGLPEAHSLAKLFRAIKNGDKGSFEPYLIYTDEQIKAARAMLKKGAAWEQARMAVKDKQGRAITITRLRSRIAALEGKK